MTNNKRKKVILSAVILAVISFTAFMGHFDYAKAADGNLPIKHKNWRDDKDLIYPGYCQWGIGECPTED